MKLFAAAFLSLCSIFILEFLPNNAIAADSALNELKLFKHAVRIEIIKSGLVSSWGSGVLIDGNMVITAAHVVDDVDKDMQIRVVYKNIKIPADLTFLGNRNGPDLALLKLKQEADVPNIALSSNVKICSNELIPAQKVSVFASNSIIPTTGAVNPEFAIYSRRGESTEHITAFLDHGTSGGGVFDVTQMCLCGIISHYDIETFISGETKVSNYGTKITGIDDINAFLHEAAVATE